MAKTTGLASISEGRSDLHSIDPRKLKVRRNWNSRDFELDENKEHVEFLAGSIAKVGVKQPLTVIWEDGQAFIDDGECRLRATMLAIERGAQIKTVPCKTVERYTNEADRLFNQWLSNTGKQFNQLETAKHFKRLLDMGWQQQDIAEKAGKTQGWVSQVLAILTAPVAVQQMIGNGQIAPTLAMQIVRSEGSEAENVLRAGLETAKANGETKVKPDHVGKASIKSAVKDAMKYSDIDDSSEDICVIKMPMDKWDVIKNLLKL